MQKICLISFDNWKYDQFIIKKLNEKGISAYHINLGSYKHASFFVRFINFLSKIFLGKNLKNKKKQDFIIETLKNNGLHDQILVINPDVIEIEYHKKIKEYTKIYNAYLYDSVARFPVEHLLNENLFDTIFSFDIDDCKKYGFIKVNNYIYLDKQPIKENNQYNVLTISSFDKRFTLFNNIGYILSNKGFKINFIFVSRNITYKKIKYNLKVFLNIISGKKAHKTFKFRSKKISNNKLLEYYQTTDVILDLVQGDQTGLSFRVFEAMALQKKLITDNPAIKNYNFYNTNNILVIDKKNPVIPLEFLESKYESILDEIYNQYTIDSWVKNIFSL